MREEVLIPGIPGAFQLRVEVDGVNRFRCRKNPVPEFSDNVRSVVPALFVIHSSGLPKAGFATTGRFDHDRAIEPGSDVLPRRRKDILNRCCLP